MSAQIVDNNLYPPYSVETEAGATGTVQRMSLTPYATRTDQATATVQYVGDALPGTLPSASSWRIFRLTTTATTLVKEYADGNANFDNIWDSRAGLSYS